MKVCTVRFSRYCYHTSQEALFLEHSCSYTLINAGMMPVMDTLLCVCCKLETHRGIGFFFFFGSLFVASELPRLQLPQAHLQSKDVWHANSCH